ncbi:hypothetical protein CEQ90_09170 [Lewinellaceae bacterium SD302]|nr:hypothetical protein CEQ90_09170 [Lewinellaceae bacterium SD302]
MTGPLIITKIQYVMRMQELQRVAFPQFITLLFKSGWFRILYSPRSHQLIFDGRFFRLASPPSLAVATAMPASRQFASRKNHLVKFSSLVAEGSIAK